jgi:hypothetical protein
VIEEEAFEETKLKKLVIPGSLQYIGARMCPRTTELLLTRDPRIPKFQKWKASFMLNQNVVMGILTGHEVKEEYGEDGKAREEGKSEKEGKARKQGKTGQNSGAQSSKCCILR